MLGSMAKMLDGLLFAGPALALLLGAVFALASSSSRLFARRPLQVGLGIGIPMLVSLVGVLRLRPQESDTSVLLAVGCMAFAACAVGFAAAYGFGVMLRSVSQWLAGHGSRHQFGDTGVSTLIMRRRKELPPGPRIKQGK